MAFDAQALLLRRLENADVKIGLILALVRDELRVYPGDDALRIITKILDIIDAEAPK
jgi:hypothetical protein